MSGENKQVEIKSVERLPFDSAQIKPYRVHFSEVSLRVVERTNQISLVFLNTLASQATNHVTIISSPPWQNGKLKSRDVLKSYDTVAIVLYNEDRRKLILLRQFRPAVYIAAKLNGMQEGLRESSVSGYVLESCGGKMDKEGKSAVEIAQEEIWEETGYRVDVKDIELVASCRSAIGLRAPLHYTFYCTVRDSQLVGSPEEQIEIVEMSPEEVRNILHVPEESCSYARPASMLYGLTWFLYEKLPSLTSNDSWGS